jgi:predicted alpha/beta superfamily hydrolase
MKNRLLLSGFLGFFALSLFAQLTFKVTSIPSNTPSGDQIFVAGNFQGWNPGSTSHILNKNIDGSWQLTISPSTGPLQFKFSRGSWAKVESNASGGYIPNRTHNYTGGNDTLILTIAGWEDLGSSGSTNSTAAPNVKILSSAFNMPQLNRNRRIWIYLPPDYENSQKRYPVLYMHDGQNVFDASTSFAGEWKVDESLNDLHAKGDFGCIVVAIDNGQVLRTNELSPWFNASYKAGGEGAQYMKFITETLKPHIDSAFRTRPAREYTALMGSSLGGLISHYGLLQHQKTFSKAGILSPAYWFNNEIDSFTNVTALDGKMKFYIIAGQNEGSGSVVRDVDKMTSILTSKGLQSDEVRKLIHQDGQHSEWYWAREFPAAYIWLFKDSNLTSIPATEHKEIKVFPNPADSVLNVHGFDRLEKPNFRILNIEGKLMMKGKLTQEIIDLQKLPAGAYVIQIFEKKQLVLKNQFILK